MGVDPILVRVAFIALAFVDGLGLVAYLALWVLMPVEQPGDQPAEGRGRDLRSVLGWVMVVVGAVALLERLVPQASRLLWPTLLILIGAFLLIDRKS